MKKVVDHYYVNKECGNIHRYFNSMLFEFAKMYGGNDDASDVSWHEYYDEIIRYNNGETVKIYYD